ncbi:MAG: TVP38/TMEM64 family protein [Desulfobacteraceae bacterium]|nr:TVP38/TMEM64 family protein [Desulfobacteraceae bacterium]
MGRETGKPTPRGSQGAGLKIIAGVFIVAGALAAAIYLDLPEMFRNALAWIDQAGPIAPLVFSLLYVAACVFMLPGAILTLGAGAVFGVVRGSLLVSLASTLGATAAFLTGRYLARSMVARRVAGNPTFKALDEAVAGQGWKIVGLTRLSPVFPFNLLNYGFGLTRVSLRDYVLASWIGMIPGTVMYVYLGSLAGSLAELGATDGGRTRSLAEWGLYLLGLLATVAVTVVITRIARQALGRRMKPGAEPKTDSDTESKEKQP